MGEGVTFYAGGEISNVGNTNTQPDNAGAASGGPVNFYNGSPEYRSTGNTSNNDAKRQASCTPNVKPGGGPLSSPTDR